MKFTTTLKFPKRYSPPAYYMWIDALIDRGPAYLVQYYLYGDAALGYIIISIELEIISRAFYKMLMD